MTYRSTPICRQACGHLLAMRLVVAVPGVLELLPAPWRNKAPAPPVDRERAVEAALSREARCAAPRVPRVAVAK